MKAAIISALVASVISVGSASAAFVVTSRNIKDGTIRPVDLSAQVKRELRGVRAVEYVRSPVTELHIGSTGTATATCPSGTQLTGGGYEADDRSIVFSSHPRTTGEAWEATGHYTGSIFFGTLYAYALCAAH
jgi:hypothetical protein